MVSLEFLGKVVQDWKVINELLNYFYGEKKMDKLRNRLYLNMFFGTIGIVLMGVGALKYQVVVDDFEGYIIAYTGFLFTTGYINYLEKKAGISNKIIWIKAGISIALFLIISFTLHILSF